MSHSDMFATMLMFFAFGFVMSLFNRTVSSPQETGSSMFSEKLVGGGRGSPYSPYIAPDGVGAQAYGKVEIKSTLKPRVDAATMREARKVIARAQVVTIVHPQEEQREVTDAQ